MKVGLTFVGLNELLQACEDCAAPGELNKVNKRIVQRGEQVLHDEMRKRIPQSADNSKSGRGLKGGRSSRPSHGHARDNIPIENVRMSATRASGEVGWDLSDISEYFYMKFVNWGTTKMTAREFVQSACSAVEGEITDIARQEYEAFLAAKIGR